MTVYVSNNNYSFDNLVKELKRVRNYFGEHDKTIEEHSHFATIQWAINFLNDLKAVELPTEEEIKQVSFSANYDSECSFRDGVQYILSLLKQNNK